MGFSSLWLVNPCEFRSGEAKWLAHGSDEILENAKVFDTFKEAISAFDLVIATTARNRWLKKDLLLSGELAGYISERADVANRVAIVFGREESGLTNEEMKQCDMAVTIPLKVDFPSLNMSQAVMVIAYELCSLDVIPDNGTSLAEKEKSPGNQYRPSVYRQAKERVEAILDSTEIGKNPTLRGRILERLPYAGPDDIKLILSVARAVEKRSGGKGI